MIFLGVDPQFFRKFLNRVFRRYTSLCRHVDVTSTYMTSCRHVYMHVCRILRRSLATLARAVYTCRHVVMSTYTTSCRHVDTYTCRHVASCVARSLRSLATCLHVDVSWFTRLRVAVSTVDVELRRGDSARATTYVGRLARRLRTQSVEESRAESTPSYSFLLQQPSIYNIRENRHFSHIPGRRPET